MLAVPPLNAPNAPGDCKLQVIPVQYVTYVPPELNNNIATAISIAGGQWVDVRGTLWTQEFAEVHDRSSGTLIVRSTVAIEVPKDELWKLSQFTDLSRQRFLVLNYDRNSTAKLMGTKEEPAQMSLQRIGHGRSMTDPNRYELRVSVTRRSPCPFYLADPPDTSAPVVCPTLGDLIPGTDGNVIWGAMDSDQRAAALAGADGADIWASLSPTQKDEALNSTGGSIIIALLSSLHQTQALNSLGGSTIWSLVDSGVQADILTAAGAAVIADVDGTTLWGLLDGTQQAAVLAAAGVVSGTGIKDPGDPGTNALIDS